MRIIAGSARGRRLLSPPSGINTRPTLERVKEGMFSAVQFWLPGAQVLDLFAGSGQLGLEALSRGAAFCLFAERDAAAANTVQKNLEATGFSASGRLLRSSAEAVLADRRHAGAFDLVLVDPPFGSSFYETAWPALAGVCRQGAQVLCESAAGQPMPGDGAGGLRLARQYRYGTVMVSRYEYGE